MRQCLPYSTGDGRKGGFLSAIARGENTLDAIRMGQATAAVSIMHTGAVAGVQNREQVLDFIRQQEG